MLMTTERRHATLLDAGAIRESWACGSALSRIQPCSSQRAFDIARHDPPPGVSSDAAVAEVREVLDSIGETCPECPTLGA